MELCREKLISFISRHRVKCFLGLAATVAGLIFIPQIYWSSRPLEDLLLKAERIELYREAHPADGGSVVFYFRLPHSQSMALLVLHRQPSLRGNPNFQEIRIDRYGGFGTYTDVQQGSPLEKKLLDLIRTATVDTSNYEDVYATAPADALNWLAERIQDRKSPW